MENTNATFIPKLFAMVNDPAIPQIMWSKNGSFFVIPNPEVFAQTVLPAQFSHNNFASFVRQLNMYGFHKVADLTQLADSAGRTRSWAFEHPGFARNRPDLLHTIRRKPKSSAQKKAAAAAAAAAASTPSSRATPCPSTPAPMRESPAPTEEQKKKAQLLIEELVKAKKQQEEISRQHAEVQSERERLWKEYSLSQQKLFEQQQVTQQVLNFLAAVYQQHPNLASTLKQSANIHELTDAEVEEIEEHQHFATVPHSSPSPAPSSPYFDAEHDASPVPFSPAPTLMDIDDLLAFDSGLSQPTPQPLSLPESLDASSSAAGDEFWNQVLKFEDNNFTPFCSMEEDRLDYANTPLAYWVPS